MKPLLVEKKIIKKLLKKNNKYFNKGIVSFKKILAHNWYIILILGLICFLLFLRFKDTSYKKINENLINIEEPEEKISDTVAISDSYESDYYNMLHRVRPIGSDHPSFYN